MVPPIALSDSQIAQIMTIGRQIPRSLRSDYLRAIAERLRGRDFDDGDVYRACVEAQRAILRPRRPPDIATPDIGSHVDLAARAAAGLHGPRQVARPSGALQRSR
jgi:hypothetical protein